MQIPELLRAVSEFKNAMEAAVMTATYNGNRYENGQKAKEALIRSQSLIQRIHEVVKLSLDQELNKRGRRHRVYPSVGQPYPELNISGFLKAKDQDVVVLFDGAVPQRERITEGALEGAWDEVGKSQSETGIVVGVRSQMSSVAKNFDTLMERAFAETLNLRLRMPGLVMGEVYLLPMRE